MKVSKYTVTVKINEEQEMLYNTLSRKYVVYSMREREQVSEFLKNINKGEYTKQEIILFQELLENQLIIPDDMNETERLEYLECEQRFQEHIYKIMIYATNQCNFRCVYCEQEHQAKRLEGATEERIIKFVKQAAEKIRCIEIDWFGGEPLLEIECVLRLMKNLGNICKEKSCKLIGTMTTNGYLFTDDMLQQLWECHVREMQITVDGNRAFHDAGRIMPGGKGTYDTIVSNIRRALKCGMKITLRINVGKQNAENALEVLGEIPEEYRANVYVSVSNIFQNAEVISTYPILRKAMEMGFFCHERRNRYAHCHACLKNAIVVNCNGDIILCSNTDREEKRVGYLTEDGNIRVERIGAYYKMGVLSARENPRCRDCVELPYCIGSCKYKRMKNNVGCTGHRGDGLKLEERALLDYYYDRSANKTL